MLTGVTIGGGFEPQNWENQGILEKYIADTFMGIRGDCERTSRALMMGDWTGKTQKNQSLIALAFASPDLFKLSGKLGQDQTGFIQ